MPWVSLVVGVIAAGAGAAGTASTNRANKKAAAQAEADEMARREAASAEMQKAFAVYNGLRKKRKGVKFEDWRNEYAKGIADVGLRNLFQNAKREDFEYAADLAERATNVNLKTFGSSVNALSGGKAGEMRDIMSNIATEADAQSAYKRAMELESTLLPAGSVAYDESGRLVRGQRADKHMFSVAHETAEKQRDIQFRMTRDLFNDFTGMAERQQERAREFLPTASYEPIGRGLATRAMETRVDFQRMDESNQFQLIRDFAAAAMGNQTATPMFQNPGVYSELISKGIDTAVRGAATYASNNAARTNSTPSYTK